MIWFSPKSQITTDTIFPLKHKLSLLDIKHTVMKWWTSKKWKWNFWGLNFEISFNVLGINLKDAEFPSKYFTRRLPTSWLRSPEGSFRSGFVQVGVSSRFRVGVSVDGSGFVCGGSVSLPVRPLSQHSRSGAGWSCSVETVRRKESHRAETDAESTGRWRPPICPRRRPDVMRNISDDSHSPLEQIDFRTNPSLSHFCTLVCTDLVWCRVRLSRAILRRAFLLSKSKWGRLKVTAVISH